MVNLKKDRKKSNKIILPNSKKNKYSKKRYDFSGYDTKNRKKGKIKIIKTGKRGGKYVVVKGKKRYLRK